MKIVEKRNETFSSLVEIIYDVSIQTRSNADDDRESAVFLTLIGKDKETRKHLLQTSLNNVRPLQNEQIDRFSFVDRDIGPVRLDLPRPAVIFSRRFPVEINSFFSRRPRFSNALVRRRCGSDAERSKPVVQVLLDRSSCRSTDLTNRFRIPIGETIDEEKIKTIYNVSDVTGRHGAGSRRNRFVSIRFRRSNLGQLRHYDRNRFGEIRRYIGRLQVLLFDRFVRENILRFTR